MATGTDRARAPSVRSGSGLHRQRQPRRCRWRRTALYGRRASRMDLQATWHRHMRRDQTQYAAVAPSAAAAAVAPTAAPCNGHPVRWRSGLSARPPVPAAAPCPYRPLQSRARSRPVLPLAAACAGPCPGTHTDVYTSRARPVSLGMRLLHATMQLARTASWACPADPPAAAGAAAHAPHDGPRGGGSPPAHSRLRTSR